VLKSLHLTNGATESLAPNKLRQQFAAQLKKIEEGQYIFAFGYTVYMVLKTL
jgi:hypothetical protein